MSGAEAAERFMRRAIELAEAGRGLTSPNPMVGAIVVTPAGEVVGEGFHARVGAPHAKSTTSMPRRTSPRDSSSVFP